MSRLVRVKRRLEEEPASVLYLSSKRLRRSDGSFDRKDSITLKFAGTVDPKGSPAPKAEPEDIVSISSETAVATVKKRVKGGVCRIRRLSGQEHEDIDVNALPLSAKSVEEGGEACVGATAAAPKRKAFEIFDVVLHNDSQFESKTVKKSKPSDTDDAIVCNGVPMEVRATAPEVAVAKREEHEFVYDLYLLPHDSEIEYLSDPIFYLESDPYLSDRSLYNEYRDIIEGNDEDRDSNAEDNPGNDYPDEGEDDAEEDDDDNYYCRGVEDELHDFERLTMGGVGEESEDDDDLGAEEFGLDDQDDSLVGYAAYKKRVAKELRNHLAEVDSDGSGDDDDED